MSNAECLVLGLLHEGFRYGHEIDKVVDERHIRLWARISRVSIYQVLDRLADRGWADAQVERVGSAPDRMVYTLTPAGLERLTQLVTDGLASQEPVRFDYDVPLSQLDVLPLDDVVDLLERRRAAVQALRASVERAARERAPSARVGGQALIRHARDFYRMEEAWLDGLISELRQQTAHDSH